MQKIIIVECISTSMNYIEDIKELGYEPIILETYNEDGGKQAARRKKNYVHLKKPLPKIYSASKNYDETLKLCKEIDPILILPGSEMSVELATTLAYDIGLKGNDKHNLPQMTRKFDMHNALKNAGLRYIHGKMVSNAQEAIEFFESNNSKPVVLKPTHSAGSLSVHVCNNADQITIAFNNIFGTKNMFGDTNTQVLVQEAIEGTEYVVNTMTRDGKSYVDSMYKYTKKQQPGGPKLYFNNENLVEHEITPEISEMIDYALEVNKAIGIKYGPVHAEFFIDQEGPVLVEVNCRICGGDMHKEFLDAMFGHHETNRSLEAYLDEEGFEKHYKQGYKPVGKGYLKTIIVPYDIDIVDAPIARIAKSKESFIYMKGIQEHTKMHVPKTNDLYSNGGMIGFAHKDYDIAYNDCKEICDLEENHFDQLFTQA